MPTWRFLNVAVVGTGALAQHYLSALRQVDRLRLVAVVDANLERATRIGRKHEAPPFPSLAAMNAAVRADAVISTVWKMAESVVARQALDAGQHVLLTDPTSFTLEEGEATLRIAEQRNRLLVIAHPWPYRTPWALNRVRKGAIGNVRQARGWLKLRDFLAEDGTMWGGMHAGAITGLAGYPLSHLLSMIDSRPIWVRAEGKYKLHGPEYEAHAVAMCSNKVQMLIDVSLASGQLPEVHAGAEVIGDKGTLTIPLFDPLGIEFEENAQPWASLLRPRQGSPVFGMPPRTYLAGIAAELLDWARACLRGSSLLFPTRDALEVARLIRAMRLSSIRTSESRWDIPRG